MYETEFKKKMVYLHLNEGRTIASLSAEYGLQNPHIGNGKKSIAKNASKMKKQKKN